MPKKKPGMTPAQQSESFRAKVRELIDAGELNLPTPTPRSTGSSGEREENRRKLRIPDLGALGKVDRFYTGVV